MTSTRNDRRIIIHFDYDCFYASVFEHENPSLKSMPLAVQQKQIIVTCNYEARRRGLNKLQLISEARKICPDVVIVLGEELGRFRDASKSLYKFLESFSWNGKVERLGFDEVWMDVTDLIDYNQELLNLNDLENSFFQLNQNDLTSGFPFNATKIAGHTFPATSPQNTHNISAISHLQDPTSPLDPRDDLLIRLILGSHIAQYLRLSLDEHHGYTSTVGVSTNKILSKLVGNLNKPRGQTTLLPPYTGEEGNIHKFLDGLEIGKIPGVGFKMAQKIRNHILERPAGFETNFTYNAPKDNITVANIRKHPNMSAQTLEQILNGPGTEKYIGAKTWNLINGIDNTEVQQAKKVPNQISIEDSYIQLDKTTNVIKELKTLTTSLIKRMHIDLIQDEKWLAHPKTLRLSTRPRGTRTRSSRSTPLPNYIFNLNTPLEDIVEKLVNGSLIPIFHKLHPSHMNWDLGLMNVAVMNIVVVGYGRDIQGMFKRQEEVLKDWKVEDCDFLTDSGVGVDEGSRGRDGEVIGSEDLISSSQITDGDGIWDDDFEQWNEICVVCGATMPAFAMAAHERFHDVED